MSGVVLTTPSVRTLTCFLIDTVIVAATLFLAIWLRFAYEAWPLSSEPGLHLKIGVLLFALGICFYYNDLYGSRVPLDRRTLALAIAQSFGATAILLAVVYYMIPSVTLGRGILLIFGPLAMLAVLLWRDVYYRLLKNSMLENVIIMGTGPTAQSIARQALRHHEEGYRVLGFLSDDPDEIGLQLDGVPVLGTFDQVETLGEERPVDTFVVAVEDRRGRLPLQELLRCRLRGLRVLDDSVFFEVLTGEIPVRNLNPSSLIFSTSLRKSRQFRDIRRAVEIALALFGLVLAFPVMLLSAILIWLDTGRPILYRQERVGELGKVFTLYKLRTMKQSAEASGAVWATPDGDPRITAVGRFLRTSRLDELPQLYNVLKGDMSFVGPRPERPCFVEKLEQCIPYYMERHTIKPGITGWAQVKYKYASTIEEAEVKLRLDLYYIKNMSFWTDFTIVLETFKVVLFGRGAV